MTTPLGLQPTIWARTPKRYWAVLWDVKFFWYLICEGSKHPMTSLLILLWSFAFWVDALLSEHALEILAKMGAFGVIVFVCIALVTLLARTHNDMRKAMLHHEATVLQITERNSSEAATARTEHLAALEKLTKGLSELMMDARQERAQHGAKTDAHFDALRDGITRVEHALRERR